MKAFMWVLMIAVVVAMPLSAWAQDDWVFLADAEAGLAVDGPDTFTDRYSPVGYGAGLGIGAILSPDVMLLVYFSYTYLPIDETGFSNAEELPGETTISGGNLNMLYGSVGARYNLMDDPPLNTRPYLVAGVGWFYAESEDVTVDNTILGELFAPGGRENALGVNVGIGVDFPISPTLNGFVEVQYQVGFVSGGAVSIIPVRLGLAFLLGQ